LSLKNEEISSLAAEKLQRRNSFPVFENLPLEEMSGH
jgi:hypothetical protein